MRQFTIHVNVNIDKLFLCIFQKQCACVFGYCFRSSFLFLLRKFILLTIVIYIYIFLLSSVIRGGINCLFNKNSQNNLPENKHSDEPK